MFFGPPTGTGPVDVENVTVPNEATGEEEKHHPEIEVFLPVWGYLFYPETESGKVITVH